MESPVWAGLTDVERANYKIAKDPIYWAAARLRSLRDIDKPWSPEWYQIEPLRCLAPRLLLLYGRQVGKCVRATTYVDLADGTQQQAGSLVGQIVQIISAAAGKTTTRKATVTKNIVKRCVRVKTKGGKCAEVSYDHPFMVAEGWRDAEALLPGDTIGIYLGTVGSSVGVDTIESVEDIGEHQTYSVSVLDTDVYDEQNFSAEGIFTHNTEVLAVKILFRLDTRRDYKIVVVCPFQSQVSMIYTRLVSLIEASPELSVRVRRKRENPHHEIMFDNGSFVRLFTAGVQTGKSATDVRGQSADWLVYDEADYLDDDTITTTLAVLTRAPNPELFVSSTPTGKRGLFYDWATDPSHGFRVLHCTSMEAPEWNERDELFLRKTYSAAFFDHEFNAFFGSLEAGVFKRQYIEAAGTIQDYDIDNPAPRKNELYVIGVDWNSKGIGGVMCVVGFNTEPRSPTNPNGHKFRVAYREVVDPEQWTQTVAVAAVARLNRVWNPRYIYVDHGHGEMQVEILQQHGLANRSTGLHKRVKGVVMQENTEITNPLTKRKEKKQAKNLMVELCVARLEQSDLVLPKSEDHQHGLIGQMREYEIEYVGRGGKKVYSGKNEHLLTAWMLAIFGFIMEMSDIRKSATTSEVILLDSNLEKALTEALARMKGQATAKPSPQPQQRTAPKKTLDVIQAVRMNNRGYVPRRALRAVQPLGRRKW
jgi:replicative DNA helicase